MIRTLLLSASLSLASAAMAEPCAYLANQPANLKAILDQHFDAAGLYYLPAGYGGLGESYGSGSLFRANAVVGRLSLSIDQVKESQDLVVNDARGDWLFKVKQRVHRCGDALCKELSITPRREVNGTEHPAPTPQPNPNPNPDDGQGQGQDGPVDLPQDHAPFFLRFAYPSGYPLETYVYGELVEPRVFYSMVNDALAWLETTVVESTVAQPVILSDSYTRLNFALIEDELMRPYFNLVHYDVVGGTFGRDVVISGKVPSDETYGRAIDIARENGMIVRDVTLSIDERLRVQPVLLPAPVTCRL
jgi:hypothetical protein